MQTQEAKRGMILVVEDEPVICRVCSQTLEQDGFVVDIALNGSIAEGMLKEKNYDLILIDIRTPVMNGKQLYQSILKWHPELAGQVIFTTGGSLIDKTRSFLEKSGRLFLPKPFNPDELRSVVTEALGRLGK